MRKITKLRRSIKAISPIIAVLLLIAIAVVASLVAYAWIMGYIGVSTTKAGYAVQIQSYTTKGYLVIYVQNTGIGTVHLSQDGSVYVNGVLEDILMVGTSSVTQGQLIPITQGQTIQITVNFQPTPNEKLSIKIVTVEGTTIQGSVTAGQETQASVTFSMTGQTSTSTSISPSGVQNYNVGSIVPITATPGSGDAFAYWTSTGSIVITSDTSATTTATINGAGTITATFTPANGPIPTPPPSPTPTPSSTPAPTASPTPTPTPTPAPTLQDFTFASIGTQTAGSSFQITVTAKGSDGNTYTSYTGTPTLTYSLGTISPASMSAFVGGVGTATVTVTTSGSGTITATDGGTTGTSSPFTVNPAALTQLAISGVGSTETAGTPFTVIITAQDQYNNTVTTYTASAALSDLSNSISLTSTGAFNAGVWTGSVSIKTAMSNDEITATGTGAAGQSGLFNVNPGPLATFAFSTIGPQTAGATFSVTIMAQDASGNNITSYTGPATLTDSSGSLVQTSTGTFTAGIWTGTLNVTKATSGDVITATDPTTGMSGKSNSFTVSPNVLGHFAFNTIEPQTAGTPFSITITAEDQYGNTITGYTGSVGFTDLSGSLTLVTSGTFNNGVYTGTVEIKTAYINDVITATDSSTGVTGSSNQFTVAAGAATQLVYIAGAGQTLPIKVVSSVITVQLEDANGNPVTATSAVTVTLTSSYPTTATFYSTPTTAITTTPITITIPAGSSSASFYFSDTQYESPVITAAATGLTSATTTFTITQYQLVFVPSTASEPAGVGVTAIQVERETTGGAHYGGGSITVQLSTSSSTGYFATLAGGVYTKITQIAISNGNYYGANTFYYIDTTTGTATLTAACPGYTSGTATFTIYTPVLTSFSFSTISSPQATGKAFSITITALDQNGNTFTSYTGTADTASLTASSGTVSPATTGGFTNGVWTGTVTLNTASTTMTIMASGGGVTGTSNSFTVYVPVITSFKIGNVGTETAGTAFSVTVTAYDQDGNVLTTYAGPFTLTDTTGTLTSTGSFANGVLTASVTITKASTGDVITVTDTGTGIKASSNGFTVNHAATAASITVAPATDSVTAGTTVDYTATATDAYGNTWTATTSVTWSISTSAGGSWSFFIDGAYTSEYAGTWTVTATLGSTKGTASLTVTAGAFYRLVFSTISSPQTSGTAFTVTITAEDEYGNTVTSFSGAQTLVTSAGTVTTSSGSSSITFVNGVWTGTVTITVTHSTNDVYLYITYDHETYESNTFTV